jgi:hypothetical protein
METIKGLRHHARFVVRWLVLYGNDELLGQGTLLDVSHVGCQLAGTMPVAVGMVLKLWVSSSHKEDQLCVEEARVIWVRGQEFGLELRPQDRQWLMAYLDNVERRVRYRRTMRSPTQEDLAALPPYLPVRD